MEQLKDIADIVGWCGSGSRVILITQDKNLLDKFGVKHVYEVSSLNGQAAKSRDPYLHVRSRHDPKQ